MEHIHGCWELDVAKLLTVYIIVNLFILCIIASYFLFIYYNCCTDRT